LTVPETGHGFFSFPSLLIPAPLIPYNLLNGQTFAVGDDIFGAAAVGDEPTREAAKDEPERDDGGDEPVGPGRRFRGDSLSVFEEQEFCIATAHDFLKWFSKLEEDVRLDDYSPHLRYLADLNRAGNSCNELARDVSRISFPSFFLFIFRVETASNLGPVLQIDAVVDSLKNLTRMHEKVTDKTSSLHRACEHILAEQVRSTRRTFSVPLVFGMSSCPTASSIGDAGVLHQCV
jgi:hypothetical protein